MLEPEGRQLLLDSLRPPAGYELDRAIGTTYTLDLISLLIAPLGFALFDREASDGRLIADPVALIEAVRRHADRIDVLCQAGQIGIPPEHRPLLTYLEPSIHEAVPRNPTAIFHPKMWVIRYRQRDGDGVTYRLLCMSRNLTFDRSWDTVLLLDGDAVKGGQGDPRLANFVRELPDFAIRPFARTRVEAIRELANELESVVFRPPSGFDRVAFWPVGTVRQTWPFEGRIDRILVVSPFLTQGCLARLAGKRRQGIVVSRSESYESVGGNALARYSDTFVISPTAGSIGTDLAAEHASPGAPTDEAVAEGLGVELQGLHAKLFVADAGWKGRVWTGSANATDAAFGGNVEFLVELEGSKNRCGIEAFVGDRKDGVGLRRLLDPYDIEDPEPREETPTERLERRVDEVRRAVAQLGFVARVEPSDADTYQFGLEIVQPHGAPPGWWTEAVGSAVVSCRPLTLGEAFQQSPSASGVMSMDFGVVSFERLTSFFVVQIELAEKGTSAAAVFVVNAEFIGAPEDRTERTLVSLLENGRDLIRFILLPLGQLGAEDLALAVDMMTGEPSPQGGGWLFAQWQALFEPMVRALAVAPERLDEIHRLTVELQKTEAGTKLLPPGWEAVWAPIWQAREGMRQR